MGPQSRTIKSVKNASVSFIFYILSLILQFISRRVFIIYLGSDVLGLNSTATSLLGFLNMAELGVGAAIAFTLYKPIAAGDQESIKEIIAVQGWFYKKIALIVFGSALILSLFFPIIFSKSNLPLWYAYATFGVLLFGTLLSYQFNYKQVLLSAHQLDYKITLSYKGPKIIKDILQIVAIWIFPLYGYLLWVIFEGIGSIVCTFTLTRCVHKEFPYITNDIKDGKLLKKKYPIIITKIKQLLFHKVGAFILFQASPLVIYSFTTLSLVAIYGNYMLIVSGLSMLLSTVFNGLAGGIGNIVNSCNSDKIMDIFREIYVFRFFLVICFCFGFWTCITPLTKIWVGEEYLLPTSSVILIIMIMFLNMMRPPIELFLQAKGLFNDIWAPIIEAAINLGLSCILASFWGLNGILLGILVSLIVIVAVWKPYFLFSRAFNQNIKKLWFLLFKLFIISGIIGIIWLIISNYIIFNNNFKLGNLLLNIILTLCFSISLYFSFLFFDKGMKDFSNRLKLILKKRIL